jgi:hypothetical protein
MTARLLVWGNGYVANRNVRRDAESLDVGDTGRESVGASECIKRSDYAGHACRLVGQYSLAKEGRRLLDIWT